MAKKTQTTQTVDYEAMDLANVDDVDRMTEEEVRDELKRRRRIDNKTFDIFLTAGTEAVRKKKTKMNREMRTREDDSYHMLLDEITDALPYEFFKNRTDVIRGLIRVGLFHVILQVESSAESGELNYGYALPESGDKYRHLKETCLKLQAIHFKECNREIEDQFQDLLNNIINNNHSIGIREIDDVKDLENEFRQIFNNKDVMQAIENPDKLRFIVEQAG